MLRQVHLAVAVFRLPEALGAVFQAWAAAPYINLGQCLRVKVCMGIR